MSTSSQSPSTGKWAVWVWALLFACLVWGHYGLAPVTDFVGDDWAFLGGALRPAQPLGTTAIETLRDYYRPLNNLALRMSFVWLGDRPWAFALLGLALHGGVLAVYLCLLGRLAGTRKAIWIGGALYAFAPILYDEFHWQCHVVLAYYPATMLGAFLLWVDWLETGKGWWKLPLSWLAYLAGLASYENCVPLALVFPVSAWVLSAERRWKWSLIHLGLAVLYVAYRFTHGFGFGIPAIAAAYYSEGEGISLASMVQNLRTMASWWCGGMMAKSFLGGFNAFSTLLPKWQAAFSVGSLILLGVLRVAMRKSEDAPGPESSGNRSRAWKNLFLGLLWMALAYSPHLLFPVCSRHNLLPVFGAGIALGSAWTLRPSRAPTWVWWGLGLLCLVANAGNALAWRDSGVFCRRIYRHLATTQDQWKDKQLVLFDTISLRERQTPGILQPRNDSASTWAEYQNAILLRGFVGNGMLKMCVPNPPLGIQDTEHGARMENDVLFWHDRYNPSVPHQTPMEDVYRVDCLAVATQAEP